ncbi:D-alanyl-D-alanine carboxypeptidase DacB [Lentibacillus populi]|uniref:D-alanyl-D-alanine carboxypeptidase DacB n=1 Tax=Lentibacillus populi TaxID=1827502 RepID=A0A9W5TV62_9BACI|nr:D-alanyl-D-alanine carboxypeptidase family protein [Lentibacillus populi]GGB33841.1 D-alanyl-D-alanine carboxypeptidase DacB [Lentibacillus populi]
MRFVFVTIIFCLLFSVFLYPAIGQAKPDTSANNAVLIEQSTGRVLYEKNAHDKRSIASITKIMTAIIAIESGKMDEMATVSKRAVYAGGSSIYLEQGEKMKLKDLVYGLMLRSGNDAAVAIAEHVGGSVEGFSYLMNEKARWLGMTNTEFDNPHGLDSESHYSTAYDMALLMRYAMTNDLFKKITGTTTYKASTREYAWRNKNKLLTSYYDYCTGGKTGFTKKAGRTLVSTAHKKDMDLIAVTLNAPDDWQDHIGMYEWAFDTFNMTSILKKGEKTYQINGDEKITSGFINRNVTYPLDDQELEKISKKTFLLEQGSQRDQAIIGKTIFYLDETPISEVPIFSGTQHRTKDNLFTETASILQRMVGLY